MQKFVPNVLDRIMTGDAEMADRVMKALLQRHKLDIAALERAHAG